MKISIKRLFLDAKAPEYVHDGDAGLNLFSRETKTITPGERVLLSTGIAFEIPEGYVGLVWDRSGLSNKQGLKLLGGVIDAGYRGEVFVGLVNLGQEPYAVKAGDKVAQMLIQPVVRAVLEEVNDLSETVRGDGGFGSTGI